MALSTLTPVLRAGSTTARFGPNKCLAECIFQTFNQGKLSLRLR
ncbi:hypothetical protein [Pelotomaculum schinkii]|nr:hypothetical protein [Pelotomaculum schinkii]